MPTTTKGIRVPSDAIKISALGAAMRDMGNDIDQMLTVHNPYLDDGTLPPGLTARIGFLERLASEPGTLRVNTVLDPVPADAVANYIAGRATMQQAPGWGRAICNTVGATYFQPKTNGLSGKGVPAAPGTPFAVSVRVRAMPAKDLRIVLQVMGHPEVDGALGTQTQIASTGYITVGANLERLLTVTGTMPAGLTHFSPLVQFTGVSTTYPEIGDFIYFRQFLSVAADDPAFPPTTDYFTGDSANAYWLGEPNKSPSVTSTARTSGAAALDSPRRDAIVDAGIKRRGGIIGTDGKAAVALRFDHHLPAFKSKVLPLLKTHRLPWGQMLNPARIADGTETMTYAQIANECYISGGEVWNHSYSHADIPNTAAADREVIRGFDDLTAGLPGLYIDGWAGAGQSSQMGLEGSDTPAKFYDSYPGRLVLSRHAFIRGYYPGIYQTMTGPNLVGAAHTTIDTLDSAYVSGIVRGAVAAGAGVTLMLHPNYLDTAGYMTTAQLSVILADLAARRDAGELLVLTPTAILLTDIRTDYRRNLLTTGAAGTKTGTWTETVSTRSAQSQYGVPHELTVTVRAKTAGSVTLKLKETGTPRFDVSHTLTLAAGQTATLRCLATPPRDCNGITVSLTGTVDHSDIRFHAV